MPVKDLVGIWHVNLHISQYPRQEMASNMSQVDFERKLQTRAAFFFDFLARVTVPMVKLARGQDGAGRDE